MKKEIKTKNEKAIKQKPKIDYNLLFGYIKKNKHLLIFYAIFVLITIPINLLGLTAITETISAITIGDLKRTAIMLAVTCGTICFEKLLLIIAYRFMRKLIERYTTNLEVDLSKRAFAISSSGYNEGSTGKFIGRISSSPNKIIYEFWTSLDFLQSLIKLIVFTAYLFILNWVIGLCMLLFMIYSICIIKIRLKKIIAYRKAYGKEFDKLNGYIAEIVRSEKDIKTLNLEKSFEKKSKETYTNTAKLDKKAYAYADNTKQIFFMSTECIMLGILLLSVFFVQQDFMALSVLIFMIMNTDKYFKSAGYLSNASSSLANIKTELERLTEIFDESNYPIEKFGNEEFEGEFKGNIELKNVKFAYKEGEEIIKGMSLTIPQGKTVAFVGKSGSGKTTLVSLISKLYDATSGEILLDGKNIQALSKKALRDNIALVNQFPYIFDNTIRENLLCSNLNATEEDLWEVLEKAELKAFVEDLPNKLDTVVGENGIKLSGGQKQRLAIARAFLKPSKLLMFDESTSSLDNFAQAKIQESIEKMKGQKTIVIVAHRLSTIKNADIIFMVDEGKILNQGTFEYLFENEPKFRNMFIAENIEE